MDATDVIKLATVIASIPATALALFSALRSSGFGIIHRQSQVIDLAKKRLEFWGSYLNIAIAAVGSDEARKAAVEEQVSAAIAEVRREADAQLTEVCWRLLIGQKRLAAKSMKWNVKILWTLQKFMALIFLFCGIALAAVTLWPQHRRVWWVDLAAFLVILGFMFGMVLFLREADELKYRPDRVFVTKI